MAAAVDVALGSVADSDASELAGVIVLERDQRQDVGVAWSFPDPGSAVEHAALARAVFPKDASVACSTHRAGEVWVYT